MIVDPTRKIAATKKPRIRSTTTSKKLLGSVPQLARVTYDRTFTYLIRIWLLLHVAVRFQLVVGNARNSMCNSFCLGLQSDMGAKYAKS
eukprot:8735260-Pyramimonas_sp.AAC.1